MLRILCSLHIYLSAQKKSEVTLNDARTALILASSIILVIHVHVDCRGFKEDTSVLFFKFLYLHIVYQWLLRCFRTRTEFDYCPDVLRNTKKSQISSLLILLFKFSISKVVYFLKKCINRKNGKI